MLTWKVGTPHLRRIGKFMSKTVEVNVYELKRVFLLMEEVNDLFHQESKFKDSEIVEKFANAHYSEIRELYYDVLWDMLPADVQEEIEDR